MQMIDLRGSIWLLLISIDDNLMMLIRFSSYSLSEKMLENDEIEIVEVLLEKRVLNEKSRSCSFSWKFQMKMFTS